MRILVQAGTQRFWATNPKKIDYWEKYAANCPSLPGQRKEVKILKRVK